jgi:NAD(P)H-dependent flavin oxidoreductase YrpB (nitropropane dioxygenase family)/AcrR family transcriptional regulator
MRARTPRASSRDAILRVFAEQVADRGYADTSLADVAAELDLSKGTIVHHFGSKETLLRELHVAYFTRRFAEADYVLAQLGDPVSRLVAMIYALLAAHRDDRAASLACLRELVRYFDGDLTGYVREQRTRYMAIVSGILRDGADAGLFRTDDPVMSALQVFGMCNYAWTWYRPEGPQSVEDIASLFARTILGGLTGQPGADSVSGDLIARAIETVRKAPGRVPLVDQRRGNGRLQPGFRSASAPRATVGANDSRREAVIVLRTAFTELVGCQVPIQQAGMGGVATPELAAAVADAGGLGMVSLVFMPAGEVAVALDALAARTAGPVGLNVLMPFLDRDVVAVAASRVRVVEFFYADPDPALISLVHDGGALAAWQVGSLAEARAATEAGCDFIVVQGAEAGGHVRGQVSLLPLLESVLGAVDVPVVAAGGIATARGVAAVLAAGAAGARLGTRFVATPEAGAHPAYVEALLRASAADTVLTTAFSGMWPDAPHRVLRSCVEAAEALPDGIVAQMSFGTTQVPVPRFAVPCPTRDTSGAIEAMALYAGESAGAVTQVMPAADVVRELAEGAERLLRSALPSGVLQGTE